MTAFEEIVLQTAKHLASIGRDEPDPIMEQRFAITIIQARAAECRHLSGGLLVHAIDPTSPMSRVPQIAQQFSRDLSDRSANLERLGMEWSEKWPPDDIHNPPPRLMIVPPNGAPR